MSKVLITREQIGTLNGVPLRGRTYVTGPWFGRDVYSSTDDRAEASRFERAEAEHLLALGKWRGQAPRIEDAS